MNMATCRACGAFLQPDWDKCKICGVPAGADGPPPSPPPGWGGPESGPIESGAGYRAPAPWAPQPPPKKTDPWPVVLGIVALLTIGGLAALFLLGGSDDDDGDGPVVDADGNVISTNIVNPDGAPASPVAPGDAPEEITPEDGRLFAVGFASSLALELTGAEEQCLTTLGSTPEFTDTVERYLQLQDREALRSIILMITPDCIGTAKAVRGQLVSSGVDEASATCVSDRIAADPLAEIWFTAESQSDPEAITTMTSCLSPEDFERLWGPLMGPDGETP